MVDVKFEFRHVFKFSKLIILQPENLEQAISPSLYP